MCIVKAGVEHRNLLVLRFHPLRLPPFSVSLCHKGGNAGGGREGGREDPVLYYMVGSREMIGCFIKADRTSLVFVTSTNPKTQTGRKDECVSLVFAGWRGTFCLVLVEENCVSFSIERRIFTFFHVLARPRCDGHVCWRDFYSLGGCNWSILQGRRLDRFSTFSLFSHSFF